MTTSLYPAVRKALYAVMKPLEAVQTYQGWAVTDNYDNNLLIGVFDPQADGPQESGLEEQSWHGTGSVMQTRDDNGQMWCTASAWNGDDDAAAALDSVAGILAIVENQIRIDPTLGNVPGLLWAEFGTTQNWREAKGKNGAYCACSFTISFRGLI